MNRLLLLLTISIIPILFAAPILEQNVTISTTTNGSVISTSTLGDNTSKPQIVVESGENQINVIQDDGTAFVMFDDKSDSTEDENKIETKVAVGDAPKIISHVIDPLQEPVEVSTRLPDGYKPVEAVPQIDDEDFSEYFETSSGAPIIVVESESTTVESSTTMPKSKVTIPTVYESSITSPSTSTTPKPIAVITLLQKTLNSTIPTTTEIEIPTDDTIITPSTEVYDLRYNGTEMAFPKENANLYPKTLWEETNEFLALFTKEHSTVSVVVGFVAFAILFMLIMLVSHECFKCTKCTPRRRRNTRYPALTADLYNTSSCSQYYMKPTVLPNQQNVTMQLIPSDVSSDAL
uniref:LITAF domain-containing protein n=1 Tax=Caenorhabditis tropicalis TaxID=1561998 RepID=A0A1I7T1Q4_9PELO